MAALVDMAAVADLAAVVDMAAVAGMVVVARVMAADTGTEGVAAEVMVMVMVMVIGTAVGVGTVMVAAGGAVAGMVTAAPAGCGRPVVGFGLAATNQDQAGNYARSPA